MPPASVILAAALFAGVVYGVKKAEHPVKCGVEKVFTLGHRHCAAKTSPTPMPTPMPAPEQK